MLCVISSKKKRAVRDEKMCPKEIVSFVTHTVGSNLNRTQENWVLPFKFILPILHGRQLKR